LFCSRLAPPAVLWTLYCRWTPGRTAPLLTNAFGVACEAVYCALFAKHARGDVRTAFLRVCGAASAFVFTFALFVTSVVAKERRAGVTGFVTDVVVRECGSLSSS